MSADPGAVLVAVYRARNAALVEDLIAPALAAGYEARLWALDRPARELAATTLGSGPAGRFELVNRLVADGDLRGRTLVVADDDARFSRGTLVEFLELMRRYRLDLAQPAHGRGSHWTHPITRAEPLTVARETTFVEIGPLFAVAPPWVPRVCPFPELGMGWGLELDWLRLHDEGCRLGIVDRTRIVHLAPVGESYAKNEEGARVRAAFDALGLSAWADVQHTLRRWRPWQRPS